MVYKNINDVLLKAQNVFFCVGQNFHEQITKGMFLAKYMKLKVLVWKMPQLDNLWKMPIILNHSLLIGIH